MYFSAPDITEGIRISQEEVLMVAGVQSIGEQVVAIHLHQTEDIFRRVQSPGIK
jgi:ribosomal protein L9